MKYEKANLVYFGDTLLPGLPTIDGGTLAFHLSNQQEQRTFTTYTYFSGFAIASITLKFEVDESEVLGEAILAVQRKYAPHPINKMPDSSGFIVANQLINKYVGFAFHVQAWTPPLKHDGSGRYEYSVTLYQAFPWKFRPAPPKAASTKNGSNAKDVPLNTNAAIIPRNAELPGQFEAARQNRAMSHAKSGPAFVLSSDPLMSKQAPEPQWEVP